METETHEDDARKDGEELAGSAVPVDPDDASEEKNQPRQQQGRLAMINTIVNGLGVAAVVGGFWVAIDTLKSIDRSVTVAEEAVDAQLEQLKLSEDQLRLSREQFTASLDALWLDQRPWLQFSRAEVRGEVEQREGASFRFHVLNSGKTPAFNVRLLRSSVRVHPNSYRFSEPSTWIPVARATTTSVHTDRNETTTVFPTSPVYYDIEILPYYLSLGIYTQERSYIAVAARLEYCDANRSLHWTQLGVAKIFSETDLTVQHSTASLHPGEADHPNCQDEARREP